MRHAIIALASWGCMIFYAVLCVDAVIDAQFEPNIVGAGLSWSCAVIFSVAAAVFFTAGMRAVSQISARAR